MNQTIKWQTCDRYGRHVSSDNQIGEYTYITQYNLKLNKKSQILFLLVDNRHDKKCMELIF